uniref:Uncharacterized protein n=1 Tax=Haemonchus contortus TaxID=6289 RepID=A0A7I4YHY1_HAECO
MVEAPPPYPGENKKVHRKMPQQQQAYVSLQPSAYSRDSHKEQPILEPHTHHISHSLPILPRFITRQSTTAATTMVIIVLRPARVVQVLH